MGGNPGRRGQPLLVLLVLAATILLATATPASLLVNRRGGAWGKKVAPPAPLPEASLKSCSALHPLIDAGRLI